LIRGIIFPKGRIVEQSHLPAKRTLDQLGIPRRTFYRCYDRFLEGGPEGPSTPGRVWNRIEARIQHQIVEMALEHSDLSPRELAVRFTDERRYFVSVASVYRLLKAHDLITSPAYTVIKGAEEFRDKTTRPNEIRQTGSAAERRRSRRTLHLFQDHRVGLDVSLDRARRLLAAHVIAWKLCSTMCPAMSPIRTTSRWRRQAATMLPCCTSPG
jgi:putative transposase